MMGERDGPVAYLMRIRLLLEEARVLSNWKFGPRGLHSRNAKVITWRAKHLTVRTAYVLRSMVFPKCIQGTMDAWM